MSDEDWFAFFSICARVLGPGSRREVDSTSWCGWTTFRCLQESVHYWSAGVPSETDLWARGTKDSGPWSQPFLYQDLAHVIVPKTFYWENASASGFSNGTKQQDIEALSRELEAARIQHRLTELVLEIKLY
jgi:hypothetical protein